MCFSAEASFVGAAVVGGVGVTTLTQVRRPREAVYGALPLAFAFHQFLEGLTWTQLNRTGATILSGWAVHLWVLYAWALLPLWLPLGIWLIEPNEDRRRRLFPFVILGAAMMAWMMTGVVRTDIAVRVVESNLDYVLPYDSPVLLAVPYVLTTCVAAFFSSFRWVRIFGWANLAALTIAALMKAADFSSIWCTFAAFLSVMILVHFRLQRRADREGVPV